MLGSLHSRTALPPLLASLKASGWMEETSSVLSQIILSTVAIFTEHHNKSVPSHARLPDLDQLLLCESSRALLSTQVVKKPARIKHLVLQITEETIKTPHLSPFFSLANWSPMMHLNTGPSIESSCAACAVRVRLERTVREQYEPPGSLRRRDRYRRHSCTPSLAAQYLSVQKTSVGLKVVL